MLFILDSTTHRINILLNIQRYTAGHHFKHGFFHNFLTFRFLEEQNPNLLLLQDILLKNLQALLTFGPFSSYLNLMTFLFFQDFKVDEPGFSWNWRQCSICHNSTCHFNFKWLRMEFSRLNWTTACLFWRSPGLTFLDNNSRQVFHFYLIWCNSTYKFCTTFSYTTFR